MGVTADTKTALRVDAYCWNKDCGRREGDARHLLSAEKGSKGTIFMTCPRCHSLNIIVLDKLC